MTFKAVVTDGGNFFCLFLSVDFFFFLKQRYKV